MAKSNQLDQDKRDAIERLQLERLELLQQITKVTELQGQVWKDVMERVAIIDDQLHTIDPSLV